MLDRACAAPGTTLAGKEAVVIGRSNIVGKPMAQLTLQRHCTVTIAHSRTRDLAGVARRAEPGADSSVDRVAQAQSSLARQPSGAVFPSNRSLIQAR